MKLFLTSFFQVFFVSANIYMISHNIDIGILICSFIVSYLWSLNVKKISISENKDRLIYSSGAMFGGYTAYIILSVLLN